MTTKGNWLARMATGGILPAVPREKAPTWFNCWNPSDAYQVVGKQHGGEKPEGEKDRWVSPELPVRPAANDLQQRRDAERQPDQTRHRYRYRS